MEAGKPETPEENPRKGENQHQTLSTYGTGPHWLKASALTTVPPILSMDDKYYKMVPVRTILSISID